MTAVRPFVALCGKIAPFASIALSVAPFPTIEQVRKNKDVGDLPLLPYSSLTTNAFLWTTYGVMTHEPAVIIPNLFSLFMGLYYFAQFARFAPKSAPSLPGPKRLHVLGSATIAAAATSLYLSKIPSAANIVGLSAVAICMMLFGSPLAAISTVIKTKSAKSIPLPFTIATLVNCLAWAVFGLYGLKDMKIFAPNVVGLTFAIAQVFLKVIYRQNGGTTPEALKAM